MCNQNCYQGGNIQLFWVCAETSVKYLVSVWLLLLNVEFVPCILFVWCLVVEYAELFAKLSVLYEQLSCYGTWKKCELNTIASVFFKSKTIMRLEHSLVKMINPSTNVVFYLRHLTIELILLSLFPDGPDSGLIS